MMPVAKRERKAPPIVKWDAKAEMIERAVACAGKYGTAPPSPCNWRTSKVVAVCPKRELFDPEVRPRHLDWVVATAASCSQSTFLIHAPSRGAVQEWIDRLAEHGSEAAARYEASMRAHFQKHKRKFREGYSIPEPPTPELRFIYEQAALVEAGWRRHGWTHKEPPSVGIKPLGRGFSGGEYHWRDWPLFNLGFVVGATTLIPVAGLPDEYEYREYIKSLKALENPPDDDPDRESE